MGERKGTNKYYPPDFDPKKHRSLDNYHGTHPLRERAKKLGQGILVIRFEMPYNIWCDGCKNPIGMGVRYNAEKSKVGMYYTTPIYKFRMKCHLCDMYFEIKTDPANHDYVIVEGARRKEQRWDPKDNEQIVPEDKEDQKKLATDAMYKLAHGADDKEKAKSAAPGISRLASLKEPWKDDYALNSLLRHKNREKRRAHKDQKTKDKALLEKSSLSIELVPENPEDVRIAELLKYRAVQTYDEKQTEKRKEISARPIFSAPATTPAVTPDPSSSSSSSGSVVSVPGDSPSTTKRTEAMKTLTHVVSRTKPDPFSPSLKPPRSDLMANIGIIVRKASGVRPDSSLSTTTLVRSDNFTPQVQPDSSATPLRPDCSPEVTAWAKPPKDALGSLVGDYSSDSDDSGMGG